MKIRHISPKIVITLLYYGHNVKTGTIQKLVFQFNQFTLDTALYCLDVSGNQISIEPQVFDLLVYLIENRDRVVTRDEALENLWKGKVVTDSALGARIKEARKAVGDNGDRQGVIKTFHGRGYQFIAEVTEFSTQKSSEKVEPLASREDFSLSDKPSIAILPFTNMSGDSEQEYFSDGLTGDIIANLCRYRELLVIDPHSTFANRKGSANTEQFANELGVEYVTKGNIRRSGDQVRISTQLIEISTGKTIWAERIDRKVDELFVLEDEVAAKIASNMVSHIEDESRARAARKHPENMTAFDCVIRARQNTESYDPDKNASARRLLEKAIKLDPEYASAYAHLAFSYCIESESPWGMSRQEAVEYAVANARQAVALDEFDSDAHVGLGWAFLNQKKYELAEIHLDRAIECNPNDYGAFCVKSWLLSLSGRGSEVAVCATNALHLNPLAPDNCLLAIIVAHYTESRYDAALEMLTRIQEPDANSEAWRAACLAQLGRNDEAHVAAAHAIELGEGFLRQQDWLDIWPFKNPRDLNHFIDGLNKSGVLT
ncbi:MAG: winged helix-turn-helix domain-containing protein [Gammaproteobacteria bacterium]